MKKFFLIPVMALFVCVNAWGGINYPLMEIAPDGSLVEAVKPAAAPIKRVVMDDPEPTYVAQIGAVQYESLEAAFEAAVDNDVIELLADWSSGAWYAGEIDNKSLTIRGNGFSINGCLIVANETSSPITITYDGVTISSSSWEMYVVGDVTINLANGSSNSMTSSKSYGIYGYGNAGNLTISGNGSLNSSAAYQFYQMGSLRVDAPNLTVSTTSSSFAYLSNNVVLNAGTYGADPSLYVDFTSHVVTKPSTSYIVSTPAADVVAYNQSTKTTYTSLADAVEAAANGQVIYVYKNDATAISVAKNITIKTNGYTTNLSAGTGYSRADVGSNIMFTDNAIAAFLMADGTNSMTIGANADISAAGAIHVNGDKTLTINAGVEVLYKRQGDYANIVVDNGAKLTVLGSGTFRPVMHSETRTIEGFTAEISSSASNQIGNRVIDVDGELVVGVKNDAANCPHFITSSIARGSAVMVNETGVATFNNADMQVAMMSIKNYGTVTIHGGEYKSISTCKNGINNASWWAYHLNNEGIMTVNGGHFVGVQGAFSNANETAIVTINGGSFETVYGHNWATGEANTGANKDNHYALYVACYSVVNVYGGSYKVQTPSLGGNVVVLVGNNDAYNTYGIVNLYGGNFQQKVKIQARKNAQSSYPASIPSTSQWYGCFGSEAPLPAGYEYYETGDATYPYGVRAIAGKDADAIDPAQQAAQESDPEHTIPWQQETTWATDEVPAENTIVTIPVGATVTVSKDEDNKNAVADQVFVAQGATLKVEEGTTLTIGEGGVNIGNGGQLVVEPNAVVTIGAAGVITTDNDALVLTSDEDQQAVLLYDPSVAENTQPKATVKLSTKSKMLAGDPDWQYTYQRFAIPVKEAVIPTNDFDPAIHEYYDATEASYGFENYVWMWTGNAWATTTWTALEPFKGYQLANNSKNGGVTYTFSGNLIGNEDGQYHFGDMGFDYFGNSYTAAIDVETVVNHFAPDVEATVWLYDYENGSNWVPVTREDFEDLMVQNPFKQIKSMEGFLLRSTTGSNPAVIDYEDAIWNNPTYASLRGAAPAPRRTISNEINNCAIVTIRENGGKYDMVKLVEKDYLTDEFDNGADASKYMEQEGVSLYAETTIGQLSRVATNNLNNTLLSFRSGDNTNYTMQLSNVIGNEYAIRDNVTGAVIYVADDATYNFDQDANTTVPARFEIVAINRIMTGIDNVEQVSDEMAIYTVTGQYVGRDFSILPAGIYVVNGVKIIK